uniref:Uncharacterized protein n=1 Tax=Trichuris muris TaxID=70415 RepID=A0A5S6QYU9_TRIMR
MTESVNEDFQKRLRDFLEVRWIVSSISSEEGRLDLSFCIFNISGGVLRSTCVKICEETYSVVPDNKSAAFVKEALEIADSSLNGELVIYCRSCSRDMVASAMEHFVSTFHTFPRKMWSFTVTFVNRLRKAGLQTRKTMRGALLTNFLA